MQIGGDVVMWAFGLVFISFAGMVGVIWAQLNKRIGSIEESAKTDRQNTKEIVTEIFADVKKVEERIFDEVKGIHDSISQLAVASGERKAGCIEKFATKEEVNKGLDTIRIKMTGAKEEKVPG